MRARKKKAQPREANFVFNYFYRIPPSLQAETARRNHDQFGPINTMFDSFKTDVYNEIMRQKKTLEVAEILVSMSREGKEKSDGERGIEFKRHK